VEGGQKIFPLVLWAGEGNRKKPKTSGLVPGEVMKWIGRVAGALAAHEAGKFVNILSIELKNEREASFLVRFSNVKLHNVYFIIRMSQNNAGEAESIFSAIAALLDRAGSGSTTIKEIIPISNKKMIVKVFDNF
jgi:hypothetical protein